MLSYTSENFKWVIHILPDLMTEMPYTGPAGFINSLSAFSVLTLPPFCATMNEIKINKCLTETIMKTGKILLSSLVSLYFIPALCALKGTHATNRA